ncbi:MAG TPA: META domain-containing protein [Candidatus Limnocylindria bacterium]|nr:META domain-containing protein [Candidatus Limnocylindria bacterium]
MLRATFLTALIAVLGACASPGTPPTETRAPIQPATPAPTAPASPTPPAGSDIDAIIGEWELEGGTLDGQPIPMVPEAPITLTVNAIRIGGTSACNSYGADWVVTQDGTVEMDDIVMTLMLCEGPINDSEQAYLEALGRTTSVTMDGDELLFAAEGTELRFVRTNG